MARETDKTAGKGEVMKPRVIALAAAALILATSVVVYRVGDFHLYNEETAIRVAFFNECFKTGKPVDECQFHSLARYEAFKRLRSPKDKVGMVTQSCTAHGHASQCEGWATGLVAGLGR